MSPAPSVTRRVFLKTTAAAGAGLVIAFHLPSHRAQAADEKPEISSPNAWLEIKSDGTVLFTFDKTELGQGTMTAFGMILAEELDADWQSMRFGSTPENPAAWPRGMSTGGSTGVRTSWEILRKAGAAAREMLISAAAQAWGVDRATCRASEGFVLSADPAQKLSYGELAERAAALPIPSDPPLKDAKDFKILGTSPIRLDAGSKVDGMTRYASDLDVPGMLIATIERSPVFAGKLLNYDSDAAEATPGVRQVIALEGTAGDPPTGEWPASTERGIAVVADTYWQALQGRRALKVEWQGGTDPTLTSEKIGAEFSRLAGAEGAVAHTKGDADGALARADKKIEADYEVPFLAHAPMEPMNCIAHVRDDAVELWVPTQNQTEAQRVAAEVSGLPKEKVTVHSPLVGGGFGRRLESDFVAEAVRISKEAGAPVKLNWSREDDMQHDFYRPAAFSRIAAGIDPNGRPVAWTHRVVAPPIAAKWGPLREGIDRSSLQGITDLPYSIPNIRVEYVVADLPVPLGFWRSVGYSQNVFMVESFLDELAGVGGRDPLELRLELLQDQPRLRRALELAADKAGWGTPLPEGRGRGIGVTACFGSFSAEIAEVSQSADGKVRVHRVVCAVDCGPVANPDLVATQVEGGVTFGLSAALYGAITLDKGRVVQSNFDDYPILTMAEMPVVETHIVPSTEKQGGIGEPGVPPVAAAVANGLFAATGTRVRKLPLVSTAT
jgi:isoquinoline 1-oxidoreductase beta subunit